MIVKLIQKNLIKLILNKLPQDKMIYFGGTLRSMTFKTKVGI